MNLRIKKDSLVNLVFERYDSCIINFLDNRRILLDTFFEEANFF